MCHSYCTYYICHFCLVFVLKGGCASFYPLGLSTGLIPDASLTVSSKISIFSGSQARLRNSKAWSAEKYDKNAYIRVDLGKIVLIRGVATQGFNQENYNEYSGRVTHYKVSYSYDEQAWFNYTYTSNIDKVRQLIS